MPEDGRQCVPIDLDASFRACTHLTPGEPVAAYGHALYGTHFKQRRPSLSVGNLSKVVSLSATCVPLLTSASIVMTSASIVRAGPPCCSRAPRCTAATPAA